MPLQKKTVRRGSADTSPVFIGKPDTRRCLLCYQERPHSLEAHASAIRFYEDDGSPL